MRDVIENGVTLLVLAGIVLAVILGRRRGKERTAAAIAAARAEAFAEGGAAAANVGQTVQVAVDASHSAGDRGTLHALGACGNAWVCPVCAPRLLAVLGAPGVGLPAGSPEHGVSWVYDDDDDDDRPARYVERRTDNDSGGIVTYERRSAASDRDAGGHGFDSRGVEGLSRASLNGELSERRPELLADMLRRPWAYDEADPRFERGVPVANGRRGRGPGR